MQMKSLVSVMAVLSLVGVACGSDPEAPSGAVTSSESGEIQSSFDLLASWVDADGSEVAFHSQVAGQAGASVPEPVGSLDGAPVLSYVWPTTLDSSAIGFESEQGILSLAATAHPDFDDTPMYDENADGDAANDGGLWHSHWVVLVENTECGGGLAVNNIAEGEDPATPATWPGLPILIDSPNYAVQFDDDSIEVAVPGAAVAGIEAFNFDGVTSLLRVSTTPGDPLLCVESVFDVASSDLSLPGVFGK